VHTRTDTEEVIQFGADILFEEQFDLVREKRIGIVTNHSALLSDGRHLVEALVSHGDVTVAALFGPEHGIRGQAPDRKSINHETDPVVGVPVYSLFGKITKPTKGMLRGIDLLLFDIQDVGSRFYTYGTTLALSMEAAAELGIPFVVLDRPNPIRGTWMEGPVRAESLKSFVSWLPIPVVHGSTMGELASLANTSGWLKGGIRADLTVVKMKGWKRAMWYDESGVKWTAPSPSIQTIETAIVYPGTCFIEGTNVSEGRGTDRPFEYLGAPWILRNEWAKELNSYNLPGVYFDEISFRPDGTRRLTTDSKYDDQQCEGVYVKVADRNAFEPVRVGVFILYSLHTLYPRKFRVRKRRLDELIGVGYVWQELLKNRHPDTISVRWEKELQRFAELRMRHMLYD